MTVESVEALGRCTVAGVEVVEHALARQSDEVCGEVDAGDGERVPA